MASEIPKAQQPDDQQTGPPLDDPPQVPVHESLDKATEEVVIQVTAKADKPLSPSGSKPEVEDSHEHVGQEAENEASESADAHVSDAKVEATATVQNAGSVGQTDAVPTSTIEPAMQTAVVEAAALDVAGAAATVNAETADSHGVTPTVTATLEQPDHETQVHVPHEPQSPHSPHVHPPPQGSSILAVDDSPTLSPKVLNVPDTTLDLSTTAAPSTAPAQVAVQRLQAAVQGVVDEFGSGLQAFPPGELREALQSWAIQLTNHVQQLQTIVETCGSSPSMPANSIPEDEHLDTLDAEAALVRDIGLQLESVRTGDAQAEPPDAWADAEHVEREVTELRRVRTQIRCLFGGMISELPENLTLRVDDLLTDRHQDQVPQAIISPSYAREKPPVPGSVQQEFSPKRHPVPPLSTKPLSNRPRSGGTELSSVTNSSWDSRATTGEDESRRRDRKERKHRRHRRRDESSHRERSYDREVNDSRPAKKDDGALPKHWNWAEEVVKASLDPQNRWEFPAPADVAGGPLAKPSAEKPSWELPRQRGHEVASKARERAEEVQRYERRQQDPQQRHYAYPDQRAL